MTALAISPQDRLSERLRGFGPVGLAAILVIIFADALVKPLGAVLVLLWAWRSGTPWHELGYARPRSWTREIALGIVIGASLKLAMKALVMPLLGADPVNHAYHFLVGNRDALPFMIAAVIVQAGFGEETLFRGFFFERLGKLLGAGTPARIAIVLSTSLLFGLAHYANQGWVGVEHSTITGLAFGSIFAITGRIWIPMVAHAAFDLVAVAIIYADLESQVAHFIFG